MTELYVCAKCGKPLPLTEDRLGTCRDCIPTVAEAFRSFPPPKPRACNMCGAPTFDRFCESCAKDDLNIERRFAAMRALDETIPENFARLDFENARVRAIEPSAVRAAQTFLDAPYLVFAGKSGAGKTTLAIAALRQRARTGVDALFVSAWRLGVARIQHAAGDGEAKAVVAAMTAPLVLLDDVGSERATATNAVADVILARAEEGRPTWITTWLSPSEAGALYGGGVARRIFDARVIRMNTLARAVGDGT